MKIMKECWLLEFETGEWDDHSTCPVRVYASHVEAQWTCEKLNDELKGEKLHYDNVLLDGRSYEDRQFKNMYVSYTGGEFRVIGPLEYVS
jgi:hypothetical protein